MRAAEEIARAIQPWPPPRGLARVSDLVLDCYPPQEREPPELDRMFAADAVISAPPFEPAAAFRHYFGLEGVREIFGHWRAMLREMDVVPEGWVVDGPHMVVICRIEREGAEPVRAAWLCVERDGRLQTLRGFRYPSEAFERLAVLAGEA